MIGRWQLVCGDLHAGGPMHASILGSAHAVRLGPWKLSQAGRRLPMTGPQSRAPSRMGGWAALTAATLLLVVSRRLRHQRANRRRSRR